MLRALFWGWRHVFILNPLGVDVVAAFSAFLGVDDLFFIQNALGVDVVAAFSPLLGVDDLFFVQNPLGVDVMSTFRASFQG